MLGTALAAVAVVTGLFAVGVRADARESGGTGAAGVVTAGVCSAACAAVVLYGIYLIVAA